MNELFTLLQKIKENPVMYIDKPSITCLDFFVGGFPQFDIYNEILSNIKKRPGMYLGANSPITILDMLLRGYSLAQREVGLPLTYQEREFEGFQLWVEEKY